MIELKGISKSFKIAKRDAGMFETIKSFFHRETDIIQAIDDISFKVKKGEMVGYIGPNGAGKSTTIKIMTGILYPDRGECLINNRYPWKNREEFVKQIGVVFGQRSQLWWDLPVIDSFVFLKELYHVSDYIYNKNISLFDSMLGIKDLLYIPVRQLSLGQRMKCEILASMIHNPQILFLDEPTIGLDAVTKSEIRALIKRINQENGTTVILTSHDMQDIVQITKRVILIGKGKVLMDTSINNMIDKYGKQKIIRINHGGNIETLPIGMRVIENKEQNSVIEVDPSRISVKDAVVHLSNKTEINDLRMDSLDLDKIICRLYKEYSI